MASVGTNVLRKDGLDKVAGRARYIDDITFPDMLYGRTVRSTIPRGRIRNVRVHAIPDLVVVQHDDIPGENIIDLIELDQPSLVQHEVRHVAEPIVLLAHHDKEALAGVRVDIEYEELPAVLALEEASELQDELSIEKGDV